jgi:cytochrome c peroxidase
MKQKIVLSLFTGIIILLCFSFRNEQRSGVYEAAYQQQLTQLNQSLQDLLQTVQQNDITTEAGTAAIRSRIQTARDRMKGMDFWMRYLEPIAYKQLNGPLPVEWETEVFEKFEKPYKREGAGLTLAYLYLEEPDATKDSLQSLIKLAVQAMPVYAADSITSQLETHHHFYLCNRLYLLNLASIYTTGFECPDATQIVPELRHMMAGMYRTYELFNESFPATPLTTEYLELYRKGVAFADAQPADFETFDHFTFIRDYVNPLYAMNQDLITQYKVRSQSMVDFALNKKARSVFSKTLYNGQNPKGIFLRVDDTAALAEIDRVGKLLFYDPILSGNTERSCASCHKPTEFFTDTLQPTAPRFDKQGSLPRNTPTLVNAMYNHLIMADGSHYTLQHQSKAVITNPAEMGGTEQEILARVMSCKDYKQAFRKLLKYTPQETEVTFEHLSSALTYYYSKFSRYESPFDSAMNRQSVVSADAREGFNLFMSKAQCGTCHFVPQFNGVKPPYAGSEFEVLGVPSDTTYQRLSKDSGRYLVNPSGETLHAFRTGTVRNIARTMPYMHNGVFATLAQVIDFYDAGGGAGRGLQVPNQTLSSDSLKLTPREKQQLIAFMTSLNENITFEKPPVQLPRSSRKELNKRKVGGLY